jgi:hypothetical protein
MVFSRTSRAEHRRRGFTLVEYMFATSIGVLVLATALVLWGYGSKTSASLLGYVELSTSSKNALDRMSQQIRGALGVESCAPDKLVLVVPGKTGIHQHKMEYVYDPTNQSLRQIFRRNPGAGDSLTLLTGCTNFSFSIYKRVPMSNSFALYTNGWTTNMAKVVEVKWTCVRPITGDKMALENQVSAKIVMRNP